MTVARNVSLNIATQAVALIPAVLAMVVAHVLGPHDTGIYSFLAFLVVAAVTASTLGVPSAITRYVALWNATGRQADAAALVRSLLARVCLAGVGIGLILVVLALAGPLHSYGTARVGAAAAWTVVQVVAQTGAAALAGFERFGRLLAATTGAAALGAAGTLIALAIDPSVSSIIIANAVAAAGGAGFVLWPLRHELLSRHRLAGTHTASEVWRYVLPLSVIVLLDGIVWQRSEVFFLGHYSAASQIAYYALTFTLVSRFVTVLPGALGTVLMPRFTAEYGATGGTAPTTYAAGLRGTALLCLPLLTLGLVLAGPIVHVLYGGPYGPAVPVLRILLFGGVVAAMSGVASAALYSAGRQHYILRLSIVVAIVNVALDLALIPHWSAMGAAWANIAAQAASGVGVIAYAKRRLDLPIPWAAVSRLGCAAAVSAGLSALWLTGHLPEVARLIAGTATFALVFVIAVIKLPLLEPSDRAAIHSLLSRRPIGNST